MEPDRAPAAPDPLDQRRCLRLLAGASVGRVVYTVGALPAVLPIRYRLGRDGSVLLRATARSELVRAVAGALVAFEAGEVDATDGTGWSVTVLGRADVSDDPAEDEPAGGEPTKDQPAEDGPTGDEPAEDGPRTEEAPAAPEARPARQVSIRIRPELVTGRLLPDPRP
ncbi:pyridoxamine 5'-phosphate oxidase family protein [Kitasatospora sp. NPDC127111]|uniref:pyridoxamine 5'-phosphate oxidase family protein n=1 Tax=Kitasatospora sp. NPDC127111 TaxID=3345363 RepID=UPI0036328C29